ncbi:MAG TPA: hypothetical protein VM533_00805 [Fimbriiglobus sp.]|nr:hypothetical protein [Fimbriiglobus sp.]
MPRDQFVARWNLSASLSEAVEKVRSVVWLFCPGERSWRGQ